MRFQHSKNPTNWIAGSSETKRSPLLQLLRVAPLVWAQKMEMVGLGEHSMVEEIHHTAMAIEMGTGKTIRMVTATLLPMILVIGYLHHRHPMLRLPHAGQPGNETMPRKLDYHPDLLFHFTQILSTTTAPALIVTTDLALAISNVVHHPSTAEALRQLSIPTYPVTAQTAIALLGLHATTALAPETTGHETIATA